MWDHAGNWKGAALAVLVMGLAACGDDPAGPGTDEVTEDIAVTADLELQVAVDDVVADVIVEDAALSMAESPTSGPWAEAHFGQRDPGTFVLDEVAGYWLAMLLLPLDAGPNRVMLAMAIQFVLFRVVDIVKPPPANQVQRLPHGWGIVADDLIAGLYCNLFAQALFRTVLA